MNLTVSLPPGNTWNPDCEISFLKWQYRTERYLKKRLKEESPATNEALEKSNQ